MTQSESTTDIYPYDPENVPYLDHLFKESGSVMAKSQSIQEWYVTVQPEDRTFTTYAGKMGGKMTPKVTKVKQKNIGKANETSLADQAVIEAKAKWIHQVERKLYKRDLEDGMEPLYMKPMLALDAAVNPHRIKWGKRRYTSQAKLNGVRFTAVKHIEGVVKLTSREGMNYTVAHVQDALNEVMRPGMKLDGELYLGEEYELGDVTGALKPGSTNHHLLVGCMFDFIHDTATAEKRQLVLGKLLENIDDLPLRLVECTPVSSHAEMDELHDALASKGFEGIMIRDLDARYDYGQKNEAMYKYKKFQDQEFLIVGVEPDKDETGGLFVLQTDNSEFCEPDEVFQGEITEPTFVCRNKGTNDLRHDILENPDKYIGHVVTVRFSAKLKSGVPEFNRGLTKDGTVAMRNYE